MLISKTVFFFSSFLCILIRSDAEKNQCKYLDLYAIQWIEICRLHCIGSFCLLSFYVFALCFSCCLSTRAFYFICWSSLQNPFLAFGPRIKRLESSFSFSFSFSTLFFVVVFYIFWNCFSFHSTFVYVSFDYAIASIELNEGKNLIENDGNTTVQWWIIYTCRVNSYIAFQTWWMKVEILFGLQTSRCRAKQMKTTKEKSTI